MAAQSLLQLPMNLASLRVLVDNHGGTIARVLVDVAESRPDVAPSDGVGHCAEVVDLFSLAFGDAGFQLPPMVKTSELPQLACLDTLTVVPPRHT